MQRKTQPPLPAGSDSTTRRKLAAAAFLLLAVTIFLYLPVRGFDFVNYDDPDYVTGNSRVRAGITADGAIWALTSQEAGNWHPLTWISHMLDCQWFGLHGGGHHQYWRSTESLFRHALDVTSGNYVALDGSGNVLRVEGRHREAIAMYEAAVRIRPWYEPTRVHLASALLADNRPDASIAEAKEALSLNPADPEAYVDRGAALMRLNRFADAERDYREAVSLKPGDAVAHSGLGMALTEQGRTAEGLDQLREAVGIDPGYANGHYNLGRIFGILGRTSEAIGEFAAAVQLEPMRSAF